MDALVVVAKTLSPYLTVAFPDGTTPSQLVVRAITAVRTTLNDGQETPVYLLVGSGVPGNGTSGDREPVHPAMAGATLPSDWVRIPVDTTDGGAALAALDRALPLEIESLLVFPLDAPFPDVDLTRYLHCLHRDAWCDYTFADGFPEGYAPEMLRRGALPSLVALAGAQPTPWTRTLLFDVLSRDINAFDVETEAAAEDYALLRASLTVDTRANYILCRRVVERGLHREIVSDLPHHPVPDPARERYPHRDKELLNALRDDPSLRRTRPVWYDVQITTEMVQRPAYQPWSDGRWAPDTPGTGRAMGLATWRQILTAVTAETPEAVVSIGYRGEPSLNGDLREMIEAVDGFPGIRLYIETTGVQWEESAITALRHPQIEAVIVTLDSIEAATYQQLRGEGFDEAIAFVERLAREIPGRVYAQAVRMKENEWELQGFFRRWEETPGVSPLIQKYNGWAGRLPDRRVSDMTPLRRIPCRHLERDMVILVDGSVPRCIQDLDGEAVRGNVLTDGVLPPWRAGEKDYRDHVSGTYAEMCAACDEYYTVNA